MPSRRHVTQVLTALGLGAAVLLTACTSGGSGAEPAPTQTTSGADTVSEAGKGAACEQYRDLSEQVESASAEVQGITVSSEEDGKKVTELMSRVSDLTEKADAAYALCYAEGVSPSASAAP
ncbi:hypothetical protein KIH74_08720 [Kineosporia sp. J2-2]|uniref:Secreted protein n=1 Tax=Kineosporia corallincola TaxID=2835133 RepID=A0ABS5TD51_9ACTN|nr:hypothetical protein [Kineosporia corallincola]MBT0769007.1 hypothetical protein [Kineosporia corallincola]